MFKKFMLTLALTILFAPPSFAADQVVDFSIGTRGWNVFSSNQAVAFAVKDPLVRGVTCYVTTVRAEGLTLSSDPSNTSIACRQTGKMFREDIGKVAKGPEGEDIFAKGKGGLNKSLFNLFKAQKIRRIWDAQEQTYLYVSYVTKGIEGSHKISTSAISTYGAF